MDEAGGRELKTVGDEAPAKLFEHMSVPEFREYMQGLHDSLPDGSVAKQGAKDQLGNIDRSANWKGSEGEASYPPPDARQNIVDHIRLEHNAEVRRKAEENPWKKVGEALTGEKEKPTHESKQETNERQDYERQKKFYEDALKREGLTELQKQQMRSELAKLKVDWQESEQTRTNKLKEGEGYEVIKPQARKVEVVGFKSRAVKKPEGWSKQQLRPGEEYGGKAFADEKERPGTDVTLGSGDAAITIRSLKAETAKDAIAKSYNVGRYAAGAPQMMGKLRDLIVKYVGDVVVHYISNADMDRLMGNEPDADYHTLGGYNSIALNGKPVIILNADHFRGDTAIHEAFHALTDIMLAKHPDLRAAMERLRIEVLQNLPDMTKAERENIAYFLTSGKEFLTGMMTNWHMQELLKGVKISDWLAKDLGIPKWRKMTMWEGALAIIRDAIGLGPRDTSAIEAAMSLTEQLTWRDPKAVGDLMEAAGRMAEKDMKPKVGTQRRPCRARPRRRRALTRRDVG